MSLIGLLNLAVREHVVRVCLDCLAIHLDGFHSKQSKIAVALGEDELRADHALRGSLPEYGGYRVTVAH